MTNKNAREVGNGWIEFIFLNVYFQREREGEGGRGAEREGHRTPSRLHAANTEPEVGL